MSNPLLELGFDIPFDRIEAAHVEPGVMALLEDARCKLDAVAAEPGPRTWANTMRALEAATEKLELAMTVVGHLESVATNQPLRDAYNKVEPEVSGFFASIPLNPRLYAALKEYAETDEAKQLSPTKKRLLKKTLDDFRRHGAELPPEGKKRLEEISRELAELTTRFAQNTLDATSAFELVIEDEKQLAGLPDSARDAAKAAAEAKGLKGWRFTLHAPSYVPVLTYLDDASIREKMFRAYNARGTSEAHDNRPLISRILELRREKAKLLGYETFADLVLEDRMAQNGAKAQAFVRDLREKTAPHFERENRELEAFRKELEGPDAPPLKPWDVGYYAEKLRQRLYEFDEEELRPYFSVDRVLKGLFDTVNRLYGISVEARENVPVWHPSVRAYQIRDADGTVIGAFYADLFPRDEKRGGAWMNGFITGFVEGNERSPHLGLICANATPPVGERPALLTHAEVETLFHEFGHLLHHILSRVEVRSLAGTNVAWDFVELPSQIMENWCWEREALDLFACHWETGETIPQPLYEKLVRARNFRAANAMMRQLGFAALDLALHIDYDPARDGDVVEYVRRIMIEYAPVEYDRDYAMVAGFTHLFASPVGYAAGYYSYKWAEVLDADAFTRFKKEGVFNREVGREFREKILARGDSRDPMELFKDFMGREPSVDALLRRSGLQTAASA